ncbi:hypothetical protein TNIN_118631 [Trichonephila inaurata madagascariensis]|uniref:Uncharacterized protein n=1 Tax=Trichonephila inaurata madagascariensis TaxID=2747483 RepID=A0A8X7C4T8_9ARAC|nr:hypothetical protein TNIN_118631 [Trichonephila inaurata madagascariensis]
MKWVMEYQHNTVLGCYNIGCDWLISIQGPNPFGSSVNNYLTVWVQIEGAVTLTSANGKHRKDRKKSAQGQARIEIAFPLSRQRQ